MAAGRVVETIAARLQHYTGKKTSSGNFARSGHYAHPSPNTKRKTRGTIFTVVVLGFFLYAIKTQWSYRSNYVRSVFTRRLPGFGVVIGWYSNLITVVMLASFLDICYFVLKKRFASEKLSRPFALQLVYYQFPNCLQSFGVYLNADDSHMLFSYWPGSTDEIIILINFNLESTSEGLMTMASNLMRVNAHLSPKYMVEALSNRGVRVALRDKKLAAFHSLKALVVVLGRQLTFTDHVTLLFSLTLVGQKPSTRLEICFLSPKVTVNSFYKNDV
ncbi:hypothetical protein J6590_081349 [Homalodisca vitripennis]|nr:hypothetical protein J6590_081349 [Homalodisca vitripennis]